jgi:hypothetical protein
MNKHLEEILKLGGILGFLIFIIVDCVGEPLQRGSPFAYFFCFRSLLAFILITACSSFATCFVMAYIEVKNLTQLNFKSINFCSGLIFFICCAEYLFWSVIFSIIIIIFAIK